MTIPKLALIPSGYSDGRVFSVLPNSGDGDFDFSRGSNATRVNKDGLIETMPLELGEELVTNGDFATDSDWTEGTWTISGGKANVNATSLADMYQDIGSSTGKTYKITFEVSNYVSGDVKVLLGYGGAPISPALTASANGIYEVEATTNSINPQRLYISTQTATSNLSIDNISVKEVISGFDTPRLDYSDSSCPSLLLEPQRTNLIDYSEDFSQSVWQKQLAGVASAPVVTSNYTISPDGTLNADRVIFDINGGTTSSDLSQIADSITNSIGDVTNSIWIKSNTESNYNMSFVDPNANYTSIIVTTEWQRFDVTSTTSSTTSALRLRLRGSEATSDYADVSVWGAQVEEGSYATSYIPTNGAIATRYADVCNSAGTSDTFNDSEGVLFAEISGLTETGTNQSISISDGTQENRILFRYNGTNQIRVIVSFGYSFVFDETLNISSIEEYNKFSIKYKENDFALWVNGFELATDNFGATQSVGFNELAFDDGTTNNFYGNTKQLMTFNKALTDSELEELTSWESFIKMANGQNYTIK